MIVQVTKKTKKFGQTVNLINGNRIIQMQVESVKNVDPNEVMVTDISHNETDKQQFVIVSYKVTAEKGEINLDQFDGSELSIADSTGEIGTQSSNRDNGTPKNLAQGQIRKVILCPCAKYYLEDWCRV